MLPSSVPPVFPYLSARSFLASVWATELTKVNGLSQGFVKLMVPEFVT